LEFIEQEITNENPGGACIGMVEGSFKATPFEEMENGMDFEHRRPKNQWWLSYKWILSCCK